MLKTKHLCWFRLILNEVHRASQTFRGTIRPFEEDEGVLGLGAFRQTLGARGRMIPLLDETGRIGELTVWVHRPGVLRAQAALYAGIDAEFLKLLAHAGRIALQIEVIKRHAGTVTEVRLHSATLTKNISLAKCLGPAMAAEEKTCETKNVLR